MLSFFSAMTKPFSSDPALINKLTDIVMNHLKDERFGVKELAQEAGLSRSVLHRRLRSTTNQSISQFIRTIRLQKALELLKQEDLSASEIAYQVGFGSPAYFSKCFHDYFGCTPLEARDRDFPGLWTAAEPHESDGLSKTQEKNLWQKSKKKLIISALFGLMLLTSWLLYNHYTENDSFDVWKKSMKQQSIVVLPFKNYTGDPDNQYFADGIMEDILNNLCWISDLRVISRTTSEFYRNASLSAGDIAREVKAQHVLEGSVRRHGDQVRVSVQLIDARHDQHLWSANYDRELKDILGIQSDIALQVAGQLNTVISEEEFRQIKRLPTQSTVAYDHYLRGRFLLYQATSEQRTGISRNGLLNSLQCFEKAISADTSFAQAYAELANAWFNLSAWGWYQPYSEGIENARQYTGKALDLDPYNAVAHTINGAYLIWPEHRIEEGRRALLTAHRLNPNYPYAVQLLTQLLMITGPIEEARKYMDQAIEMEPYFWMVHNLNAWVYYFEQNYEKSLAACKIGHDLNPGYIENKWLFFLNYTKLGMGEKAASQLQEIAAVYTGGNLLHEEITRAFEEGGIAGILDWLIALNINRPIPIPGMNGHPYYIGWWYALVKNAGQTIYWFNKNLETPTRLGHYFNLIATNPDFDFLRNDPRFLSIIDAMELTPYHYRASR